MPGLQFIYDQGLTLHPYLWYSEIVGGIPIFATQFGISFHPIYKILIYLLGPISAFNWTTFINLIAGIVSAYWFGKMALKTNLGAAIFASIFSFSQMNMEQIYFPSVSPFFYVLPLTFGFVYKINQGKKWYSVFLILLWASAWLIGHPQFAFYTASASLLFALFLDLSRLSFSIKKPNLTTTAFLVAGLTAGILIASPWILRSTFLVELSSRAEIKTLDKLLLGAINPLTLVRFIYPSFLIPVFNITCCGGGVLYVGTAALVLAFSSFFMSATKIIKFFRIVFVSFFIIALQIPPLINIVFHLPVIKYFLYPFRTIFISNFALAMLVAYALETIYENGLSQKVRKTFHIGFIFLALSGLIMLSIGFLLPYFENIFIKTASFYLTSNPATETTPDQYFKVIDSVFQKILYQFSFTNRGYLVSLIFLFAPSALYLVSILKRWDNKKLAAYLAFLIITGPAIVWLPYYRYTATDIIKKIPDTANYIKSVKDGQKFRVLRMTRPQGDYERSGFHLGDTEALYDLYMESAISNSNIFYGLDSINGYENFMSRRHMITLPFLDDFPANKKKLPDLLAIMNVKYLLSSYDLTAPFEKVYTKNLKYQTKIYIYENKNFLPRIYFPNKIKFTQTESEKDLFNELLSIKNNAREAIIECTNKCEPGFYDPNDKIDIVVSKNGYYKIKTTSKNQNWLIVSESYYPGWEAKIDNIPTRIHRANFLFGAILLTKGEHIIEYEYNPTRIFDKNTLKLLYKR